MPRSTSGCGVPSAASTARNAFALPLRRPPTMARRRPGPGDRQRGVARRRRRSGGPRSARRARPPTTASTPIRRPRAPPPRRPSRPATRPGRTAPGSGSPSGARPSSTAPAATPSATHSTRRVSRSTARDAAVGAGGGAQHRDAVPVARGGDPDDGRAHRARALRPGQRGGRGPGHGRVTGRDAGDGEQLQRQPGRRRAGAGHGARRRGEDEPRAGDRPRRARDPPARGQRDRGRRGRRVGARQTAGVGEPDRGPVERDRELGRGTVPRAGRACSRCRAAGFPTADRRSSADRARAAGPGRHPARSTRAREEHRQEDQQADGASRARHRSSVAPRARDRPGDPGVSSRRWRATGARAPRTTSGAVRGSITGSGPVAWASRRCARCIAGGQLRVLGRRGGAASLRSLRVSRGIPSPLTSPTSPQRHGTPSLSPSCRDPPRTPAPPPPQHGSARFCARRAETVP